MKKYSIQPPITVEEIRSLNNGSVTFEQARALLNVSSPALKAKLITFNIFVWNEVNGPVRIHGGDYSITIVIEGVNKRYVVHGTDVFKDVISKIEGDLRLSPGSYKLTYNRHHPTVGDVQIQTDRDWHFAVEFSKEKGYVLHLYLEIFPSGKTAD